MTEMQWALLLHIVGVVLLFSGLIVAAVASEAARKQDRLRETVALLGAARVGVPILVAGVVAVLAGGFWMVGISDAYSFGDGWITSAFGLLLLALTLGGIGGQTPKRARMLAERLAREGDESSAEVQALLAARFPRALNYLAALAVSAALVVMIWKPGA